MRRCIGRRDDGIRASFALRTRLKHLFSASD
jgi:hypothetical protein